MIGAETAENLCWGFGCREEGFFAKVSVDELMKQIDDYMDYYNRERCSLKLKKLSPVAYRTQLAQSA